MMNKLGRYHVVTSSGIFRLNSPNELLGIPSLNEAKEENNTNIVERLILVGKH